MARETPDETRAATSHENHRMTSIDPLLVELFFATRATTTNAKILARLVII